MQPGASSTLIRLLAGAAWLLLPLAAVGSPSPSGWGLITPHSVGPVRLGMSVAEARRALSGLQLRRTSDGDGLALIAVWKGRRELLDLYAGEADPQRPINEQARVRAVFALDPVYTTAVGVHPGMLLRETERRYGAVRQIHYTHRESREYATFARAPAGLVFRVTGPDGDYAGRYSGPRPKSGGRTRRYAAGARIAKIEVVGGVEVAGRKKAGP